AFSGEEGGCDVVGVLVGQARAHGGDVFAGGFGLLDLAAVEDVHGTPAAHDGGLCGGPGEVDVCAELPGAHEDVRAAVGFAQNHGDQRHGRFSVGVEQFRDAADDSRPFLVGAGEVAGNIYEGDDRYGERVAEADEAARLLTGFDVQGSRHLRGLVGDDADS